MLSSALRSMTRGTVAGFAGTAAMSSTLWLEKRMRRQVMDFVDYDASDHVVIAAAAVLHHMPRTAAGRRPLFLLTHWGYGSVVGTGRLATGSVTSKSSAATALFYVGCQAMTFTLFPLLGGTPRPWAWRRDLLISSLAQHAVYAFVVTAALRTHRGRQ